MNAPSLVLAASLLRLFPEQASTAASDVDALFIALTLASALLVIVLVALNLTFLVRYRRGSNAPRGPLPFKTAKLEAAWIGGTTLAFLGFFFWGGMVFLHMARAPRDTYDITVVGRQWMWDVRHPNGRREFDELHVPMNQTVRLLLSSEDVIHSFYAPAFRVKMDVVPGKTSTVWFTPTREGRYHLFCAEFCGTKHSEMKGAIVVLPPERYAEWLAAENVEGEVVARGRRLFFAHGCSGCHAPQSPVRAPMLEGLYQRLVPLANGSFVRADDRYLRDSILLPQQEVAAGYEPVMPSFSGVISENNLLDLVTYLKSLRDAPAPVATPQPIPPNLPSPATPSNAP